MTYRAPLHWPAYAYPSALLWAHQDIAPPALGGPCTTQSNFKVCLESSEYTSRRNALSVLKRLIPVFPVVDSHVSILRKTLEKVRG